jgi:ubiquinone/menaquinone biosynthesis C-methylase UbiE
MLAPENETPWSDRVGQCHEQFTTERNQAIRRELTDYIDDDADAVLEVGCGTGELRSHVEPAHEYIGLDFTAEFDPDIHADATDIPLADTSVSTVVTKNCLQHIPEYETAISECCRVAADRVISVERVHDNETTIVATEPCLRRRFAPDDLRAAFEQASAPTSMRTVTIEDCATDARLAIVITAA